MGYLGFARKLASGDSAMHLGGTASDRLSAKERLRHSQTPRDSLFRAGIGSRLGVANEQSLHFTRCQSSEVVCEIREIVSSFASHILDIYDPTGACLHELPAILSHLRSTQSGQTQLVREYL